MKYSPEHFNAVSTYVANSPTHNYDIGFTYNDAIYSFKTVIDTPAAMLEWTTIDRASSSKGNGLKLRFRNIGKKFAATLVRLGATYVCSVAEFKAYSLELQRRYNKTRPYNRGEVFEAIETELNGVVWHKDNTPFTDAPDYIAKNGVGYQAKFSKASMASMNMLNKLM